MNEPAETPPSEPPVITFKKVSKWYGNVIGVNKLSLKVPPGVTGLLGPNGAGKSTLLQLATGQLKPNQGRVKVLGEEPWANPDLTRRVGLCPEQDAFYEWMTGREFIFTCARLSGMPRGEANDTANRAMEQVRLTKHMNRAIGGYSKGMRQRTKIAQALCHDPKLLFLDEPFTGTDPVARRELIDIVLALAGEGRSVFVSSHVLHEVETLTTYVVLINKGRVIADGHIQQIRDLIDQHPHRIGMVTDGVRELAAELVTWDGVMGVDIDEENRTVTARTTTPDEFYSRLPEVSAKDGRRIEEVYSEDDNLEAVFKYLVSK